MWLHFMLAVIPALASCQTWTQTLLDNFSQNLKVGWKVKDNLEFANKYFAEITLTNDGSYILNQGGNWSIYFDCIRMIEPDVMPKLDGIVLQGQGVKVTHLQGSHFRMEPTNMFLDLPPGRSRKIKFYVKYWQAARTSVMPNWYFVVPGLDPAIIQSTVGEELSFVENFVEVQQFKRYDFDRYAPFTAQQRYWRNHVTDPFDDGEVRVIPKPLTLNVDKSSNVTVDPSWRIYASNTLSSEANYLRQKSNIPISGADANNNVIRLRTGSVAATGEVVAGSPDAYKLSVDTASRVIEIMGQGPPGVFYGVQTLLSLMSQKGGIIYKTDITDSPRFSYRAMHFDVGRNFYSKPEVLRFLDNMATYKLNKLHFHLSEDEGWRLEIPGLPELTQVGAKRCFDLTERTCLYPQIGSGPFNTTSGSGFYSITDYREILQEAKRLHIQIIPEFDMPGHARAAIKAMEERFRRLQGEGRVAEGEAYLLVEETDPSRYITAQMFTDNAMNPCLESTYTFIEHVVRELITIHEPVQPLQLYHYGGDEVGPGAWENSTACRSLFGDDLSTSRVKEHFFKRVSNITASRNLNMAAWEDGLIHDENESFDRKLASNPEVYAYAWNNVWEAHKPGRAYDMANKGYKVVMSHATHLYFDHPYEPDPEERGYYWATRFTDSMKTFGFTPDSLYANIDVKRSGEVITRAEACGTNNEHCPALENTAKGNIVGLQGCLWSETCRTQDHVDSQVFPRLLSLAERAWHKASWEDHVGTESGDQAKKADWESFAKLIGRYELRRLDAKGVKYRVPPPGARVHKGFLEITATYPGLQVQYSKNGGTSWQIAHSNVIVRDTDTFLLRTRSADLSRYSRVIILHPEEALPIVSQPTLDYMAEHVQLHYEVLDNFGDGVSTFRAQVSLRNTGSREIKAGNWGLYYCNIYMIPANQPELKEMYKVTITHLKGCMFKMEPTADFPPLTPNEDRKIVYNVSNWSVSKTDAMPNWYFWAPGMKGRTVENTKGPELGFVGDFTRENQWKRYNTEDFQDYYDPYTPSLRYTVNMKVTDQGVAPTPVIPSPAAIVQDKERLLTVAKLTALVTDDAFQKEAQFLKNKLTEGGSINLTVTQSLPARGYIRLVNRNPNVEIFGSVSSSPEAYSLIIDPQNEAVVITSSSASGIFYGVQSLLSLMLKTSTPGEIPKTTIEDAPRFAYRGMHLDVGRNFHSKDSVLKLLEAMGMYKLNKFHFHLTEDEGWRVQIPGLEELTMIGGQRCHDLDEAKCVISQLGSGPDTNTSGSGYFTESDYKEILQYAADRHIEVIPEVDSPGHAHAAIIAMQARRQKKLDVGDFTNADTYTLVEHGDPSTYLSVQMFDDNALNPCMESTYTFINYVVQKLKEMHAGINPLKTFHFGGDEVARGAWLNATSCQDLLKSNVTLKEVFTRRVSSIAKSHGLHLGGWEDGLMESVFVPFNRSLMENEEVAAYAWDNVWEWGVSTRAYTLANAGYKVVMSHATHLYFDHPYEPDPEERGFYWATRFADTRKTFGYLPDTLYENVDVRRTGQPMSKTELCGEDGSKCVPLERPNNILGIQGQLWSETVRTQEHLFYMIFPRFLALAERAWHKASWESEMDKQKRDVMQDEDWKDFANTLAYQEFPALDKIGISYRVPPPGTRVEGNLVRINSPFPGLAAETSTNDGVTWSTVTNQRVSVANGQTVLVRLKSADGSRRGRPVKVKVSGTTVETQPSRATTLSASAVTLIVSLYLLTYI